MIVMLMKMCCETTRRTEVRTEDCILGMLKEGEGGDLHEILDRLNRV